MFPLGGELLRLSAGCYHWVRASSKYLHKGNRAVERYARQAKPGIPPVLPSR